MISTRKIFNQFINTDSDFSLMRSGEWINASCVRIFSSDKGKSNRIEGIGGNVCLFDALPAGTNYCMGGCPYEAEKRLLFANYNSNGDHGIFCYDKDAKTTYTVLLNSQVENGFGFDTSHRLQCQIFDNFFLYTDNKGEPKCFNIEAGIKLNQPGYTTTVDAYSGMLKYTSQTIIKRPPIQQITATKGTDTTYKNNFIADNAYFFTYRYKSKDNLYSALASYSQIIPANFKADTFNKIDLAIPITESIDDDTFAVELCVKYGKLGNTNIIKTWDKASDLQAIADHNAGTTALAYTFYDDIKGEALGKIEAIKSFDLVPPLCKTLTVARNRIFIANYETGYDTPTKTSLQTTIGNFDTGGTGTYASKWKYMRLYYYENSDTSQTPVSKDVYYLYCAALSTTSYYYPAYASGGGLPSSVNASDAFTAWNTESDLAYYIIRNNTDLSAGQTWLYNPAPTFYDPNDAVDLIVTSTATTNLQFFKSNSTYKVSIAFYDRFKRKCGVVKNYVTAIIPIRSYNQSVFSSVIQWTLNNTDALNEIPDWAYYYKIHITENQTTSFFFQINAIKNSYVTQAADLTLSYTQGAWVENTYYATAFDLTQAFSAGIGYNYNAGDLLIIYKSDGTTETLPIIGADGINVLVKPTDIGDLTGNISNIVEIHTPYKPTTEELFYETGDIFSVLNPETAQRTYSVLSGQINGDCYAIERDKGSSQLYFTETMSPNDKFWKVWEIDRGWPNAVDPIGKQQLDDSIMFSDAYVQGSKINGINVFQPANQKPIGLENGEVNKLVLANKTQEDGSVMLALCDNETISMYLGQQELFDTKGSAYIAQSDGVIGSMKALKGSFGCQNPESVFEFNGLVFFWSMRNRCAVQYSNNGLDPITDNRFKIAASIFSKDYSALSAAEITALGSYPYVLGGYDPYHEEALFSIPNTTAVPPKGNLIDYPNIPYPYDIYDGKGKTLSYKSKYNGWIGSIPVEADMFLSMDNDLYSFKEGKLYIHNQDNTANFYGTQYTSKLMFATNPGGIHEFRGLGLECNKTPNFVHFRTEDPNIQSSELVASDFEVNEGVIETSLYKDRLSPSAVGAYLDKQFSDNSEYLTGKALLTMLEFEYENDPANLALTFVDVAHILKQGTLINTPNG